MKKPQFTKLLFGVSLFVLGVSLACELPFLGTTAKKPVKTLPPSTFKSSPAQATTPAEASPTAVEISPTPVATKPVLPTATPQPELLELEPAPYVHSEGLFEVPLPVGWSAEETVASVSIAPDDESGFIYLQATNTGYQLPPEAFQNFVRAREDNFYGGFTNYLERDFSIDADRGLATVLKELTFQGVPQRVITYYHQQGQVVFSVDFGADEEKADLYFPTYEVIFDQIMVDASVAADDDLYFWITTFTGPGNLLTIDVPLAWRYEQSVGETTVVDTFFSPDDHAVIQNIAYDEGLLISKSQAGELALELLRNYYAKDIKITSDEVQPDGSERLVWNSPGGDYSGVSFFETRGTTFLFFTVMYDNPFEDVYLDVLNYTVGSYDVP